MENPFRRLNFLFGLNVWGIGLVSASKSLNAAGWLISGLLMLVGTMLLSAALFPLRLRD